MRCAAPQAREPAPRPPSLFAEAATVNDPGPAPDHPVPEADVARPISVRRPRAKPEVLP